MTLTPQHYRRRRIAALILAVIACVSAAAVGVKVQHITGWSIRHLTTQTALLEPADFDQPVAITPSTDRKHQHGNPKQNPNSPNNDAHNGSRSGAHSANARKASSATNANNTHATHRPVAPQRRIARNTAPIPKAPNPNSSGNIRINVNGLSRTATIVIPKTATRVGKKGTPRPLILAFHGKGEDGASMRRYSQLSQHGAIVAYPDALNHAWDGAPYATGKPGKDKAFVRELINRISATYNIDKHRIYAVGFSNGGGFAVKMACEMPTYFAAVAAVAGAYYPGVTQQCAAQWDAHTPKQRKKAQAAYPRLPSLLEIHGHHDNRIHYDGGERYHQHYLGGAELAGKYATLAGCFGAPTVDHVTNRVVRKQWPSCRNHTEVAHLSVADAGHTWPGEAPSGRGLSGKAANPTTNPRTSRALSATNEILAFLERNTN